jgi:hypothetical protein
MRASRRPALSPRSGLSGCAYHFISGSLRCSLSDLRRACTAIHERMEIVILNQPAPYIAFAHLGVVDQPSHHRTHGRASLRIPSACVCQRGVMRRSRPCTHPRDPRACPSFAVRAATPSVRSYLHFGHATKPRCQSCGYTVRLTPHTCCISYSRTPRCCRGCATTRQPSMTSPMRFLAVFICQLGSDAYVMQIVTCRAGEDDRDLTEQAVNARQLVTFRTFPQKLPVSPER